MTPERWEQIEQLYCAALEHAPADRAAFLAEACAGDEALRREVEALLAADARAEHFIETPPDDFAAALMARPSVQPTKPKMMGPPTNQTPAESARGKWRRPIFFSLIALLGAAIFGYFVFDGVMLYRYGSLTNDYGWEAAPQGGRQYVTKVDPQGEAAGKLEVGDEILALNDDPRFALLGLKTHLWAYPRGGPYTIRIARGSEARQFVLTATVRRDSQKLLRSVYLLALGLAFYAFGLLIGILKPAERITRLVSITALAVAILYLYSSLTSVNFLSVSEKLAWLPVVALSEARLALAYHFYYRFPASAPSGRLWSLLKYLLYGVAAIFLVYDAWEGLMLLPGGQTIVSFCFDYFQTRILFLRSRFIFDELALLVICAVIVRNYRLVTSEDQRRRIKWVVYGSIAGLLPNFIVQSAIHLASAAPRTDILLSFAGHLATTLIPITFGYAILKQRVFDINVVVRRGLQYLLAKNSLRLILALPVIGLAVAVLANPHRTVAEIFFDRPLYLVLLVAAALSLRFRQRLGAWIDRRFFREAHDQEQLLLGLIEEIKGLDSMSEIARLVSRRVDAALHPQRSYVFYREVGQRDFTLGYSSGGGSERLMISESARLLRLMAGQTSAQEYPFAAREALPPDEQAWLAELQVVLLVPMNGHDGRLLGLLLLGEKRSEQPYTATDRRLLFAIAQQMAIVYEIVWLQGRVEKGEQVKREVLSRLEGQQVNLLKECPACGACYDAAEQVCAKEGSELTLTLPVERMIDGKYRLEQSLGKGGMGAVYEATDARLNRQVAIKIITGHLFGDSATLRRFEREAQASARLNHPNIITVYDYGAIGADGAYLVMELIRGVTLRTELKQAGRILPALAAGYFHQLLEGMKAAHASGVIHRDLKLENVLIARHESGRPLVKILDFGLAKLRWLNTSERTSLTAPGMVMGTFGYMAPEQLTGGVVDERTDIFAVGVMVVEALTGSRPFGGKNYPELLSATLHQPFHLTGDSPAVQRLDAVLQRCLAKERQQRYGRVAELEAELIPALRQCPPLTPVSLDGSQADLMGQIPLAGATKADVNAAGAAHGPSVVKRSD